MTTGGLTPEDLPPAGGGDYCDVRDAGDGWLLLVARTDEASHSLGRSRAILSQLVPRVSLTIPEPGESDLLPDGRRFLLLRRVPGVPLTPAILGAMTPEQRDAAARAIGGFLGEMHATPVEIARAAGIPTGWYPFAATEDDMRDGPAAPHYAADLEALAQAALLDAETLDRLAALVGQQLQRGESDAVLLHGEVSADHVFVDPERLAVTGIIDFQGVVLGDPVRDLLYIDDSFGPELGAAVARHYPGNQLRDPLPALSFYRVWHQVVRMLWAAAHGYDGRIAILRQRVVSLADSAGH